MRYWWVNQNKTYDQEVAGGYLWSPRRKRNGDRNPFYEFMREVAPGDLIFSFANATIRTFGVAKSYAYEAPKPDEFGNAGRNWDAIGWKVDVAFQELAHGFKPAHYIDKLRPLFPEVYAPLDKRAHGSQGTYLTTLSRDLALVLADLLSAEVGAIARSERVSDALGPPTWDPATIESSLTAQTVLGSTSAAGSHRPDLERVLWEEHLRKEIERDPDLSETDRSALVVARRGQGRFRANVQAIERRCRVTGVDRPEHLRASHCKPWRDSNNDERLDGENGLLLTPSIDHVFDRGFISFADEGRLLISPVAHRPSLARMGVAVDRPVEVGAFTTRQKQYLAYHRDAVFLKARVRAD